MKYRIIFQILIDAMFPNEIPDTTLMLYIDFVDRHENDKEINESQKSCLLACRDVFEDELERRCDDERKRYQNMP